MYRRWYKCSWDYIKVKSVQGSQREGFAFTWPPNQANSSLWWLWRVFLAHTSDGCAFSKCIACRQSDLGSNVCGTWGARTSIFMYVFIIKACTAQSFQSTLHKTAQSCAWQQNSFVEALTQDIVSVTPHKPKPEHECLDVDAHISVSTCWIREPGEGAGAGWAPSLGAQVRCKHLSSHTEGGRAMSQHRAWSYHCPWALAPQPASIPPGLTHPEALNTAPREESWSFSGPRAHLMRQILHCSVCLFILVWTCIFFAVM